MRLRLILKPSPCTGLLTPDTFLGENGRHTEVFDEQTTVGYLRRLPRKNLIRCPGLVDHYTSILPSAQLRPSPLSSEDELRFLNNTVDRRRIAEGRYGRMLVVREWPFFGIRDPHHHRRGALRENQKAAHRLSVSHASPGWLYNNQHTSRTQSRLACERFGIRPIYPGPGCPPSRTIGLSPIPGECRGFRRPRGTDSQCSKQH